MRPKHINQLLLEFVNDFDKEARDKLAERKRREAHTQGIAEAYRILGIEPKPEERAA